MTFAERLKELRIEHGFSQDLDSATEEYVPDFDLQEVRNIIDIYKQN